MTLKSRLGKLEPGAIEAHSLAWARYWQLHDHHAEPVDVKIRKSLATFTKACELSDDDFDLLWERHGPLDPWVLAFNGWADAYDRTCPPANTTPALASWPHAFPEPPPEPPGLYAELEATTQDPEPSRQACALMSLVILGNARAVRDFQGGDTRD